MALEEAIEMLRGMQNKKVDYAEMVCAPAFAYGYQYVYPEPEDYVIEEAISALKEIQQYREMDRKLREAYGDCDGLLETVVEGFCRHSGVDIGNSIKSRLLTDEDVGKWDAYKEIGTVEECREAVEKQKLKKPVKDKYNHNCCPNCGWIVSGEGGYGEEFCPHCENCGQAIWWNDENLEGTEDENT